MATIQPVRNLEPSGTDRDAPASTGLRRFAWIVLGWNVLVVLWGALVRATGSGAGCGNHWPLCNGDVIPQSPGVHTVIEFTHRMMTGGSAFAMVALLVWTLRSLPQGHRTRRLTVIASVLLVVEAIIGAVLVKLGYVTGNRSFGRVLVLSIHFANTLLLLASLSAVAWTLTFGRFQKVRLRAVHVVGILATMVVGISGSLAALGDTLFPATSLRAAFVQEFSSDAPLILRLRSVHPISAVIAGIFVVWLLVRVARRGSLKQQRFAAVVTGLLVLQFVMGLLDVALLAPAWMQIMHLLGADLYWIALLMLVFESASSTVRRVGDHVQV